MVICRKCHCELSGRLAHSLNDVEAELLKHETEITARQKANMITPLCDSCLSEWLAKSEQAKSLEADGRSPAIKRLDAACIC